MAMEYKQINMPPEVSIVLITYVVIHLLGHIVLSIQKCSIDHKNSNQIKNLDSDQNLEDASGSGLRKTIGFLYIGLVWLFGFIIVGWLIHQKIHIHVSFIR